MTVELNGKGGGILADEVGLGKTTKMEVINSDITNIIFNMLPVRDKALTYHVFDEPRLTQYRISRELLVDKRIKGMYGLIKRAMTSGEYEPCVQAMMSIAEIFFKDSDKLLQYEKNVRSDFNSYDENQRVDRLAFNVRMYEQS